MKSNRPIYYKSVSNFKAEQESRKVSGYLAAFGNIDDDGDMLMPGCFLKSISERGPQSSTARKIAFLDQHDMKEPIGVFTLLQEDEKGLYFEAVLDETECGETAMMRYVSGSYNQHSIGFQYVWDKCKWEDTVDPLTGEMRPVFKCYELKLWEGSAVTLGANENTPFTGFKSLEIEQQRKQLNARFERIVKELNQEQQYELRQTVAHYIALAETEPIESLKEKAKPQQLTNNLINAIKELSSHEKDRN